ncbi:MAG: SprB repeat-containing protein, partial [Bacteroidota bacterium]
LNANLVDWEELAKDDVGNFYIGDFGNNGNARTNQKIYIIPNPDSLSGDSVNAQVINLSYADQPGFPPINSRRHYDMEAMIWYQDSLFLFSKNRTNPFDGYTRMYKLPAVPGTYAVSPVDSFYTGPGPKEAYWITGADMSPSGEQLILQSYDKMWLFSCFNGSDFFGGSIQQIGLSAFGQYEGVSFLNEETLYISNETSAFGTAALNKVDISSVVITPFIDLGPDISTLNSSIMLNAGSQPNGSTYLWSNGTTGQQTTIANSGTYWVQVSNGSCTSSDTINVSFLCQGFASGVSGTNIDCFGSQNGSIDLTVVGGAPSYTYSWSTGDTVQDLNNLSAGVYSVDLSDQNGCTRQHTLTITEPAPLQINVSPIDLLCNGSPTGSIDLSVSGGTQGYTFSWSNGVTTEDLSNIPAGTYSVQIADANNCVDSISQTISEPSPIVVGITPSPTLCFGEANGSINLNVSGGTPAYRFVWSNGDTTQNISNLLAGVYAVIITDANNCPTSISDTIVNAPPIGISLSSTDASCANVDDGGIPPATMRSILPSST